MADTKQKKAQYVAYVDLGNGVGAKVNPDEHGGEDSDDFQYMLERRTVVPISHPDAAIAMGQSPGGAGALADERDAEIEALRAKIAELEAAQAKEASKDEAPAKPAPTTTTTGGPGSKAGGKP